MMDLIIGMVTLSIAISGCVALLLWADWKWGRK